jgi:predicted ester cyclase
LVSCSAFHDPNVPGGKFTGPQGFKQFVEIYRGAFPDVHFTINDQIAEGDKVATRWTATGTHKGALMGIAATNKRSTVTGTDIGRYADGKVVEETRPTFICHANAAHPHQRRERSRVNGPDA